MSKEELLDLSSRLVDGWKFVPDEQTEGFKLIKVAGIDTEDGIENQWVATIFDMDTFFEWLEAIK